MILLMMGLVDVFFEEFLVKIVFVEDMIEE